MDSPATDRALRNWGDCLKKTDKVFRFRRTAQRSSLASSRERGKVKDAAVKNATT